MNDDDLRDLFREMRDEPVPAESIARVHIALSEKRAATGIVWWKPLGFVFSAACIALLALFLRPKPTGTIQLITRPPIAQQAAQVQPPVEPIVKKARPVVTHRKTRPKQLVASIRIETPDPDVVILLLGD